MPYLIGMDEAGYGPNLGPLLISASAWWIGDGQSNSTTGEVQQDAYDEDLYARLGDTVTDKLSTATPTCIAIADSKQLYKPGGGLKTLERGLFSAIGLLGHRPVDWHDIWQLLAADSGAHRQTLPWYEGFDLQLPTEMDPVELDADISRMQNAARRSDTRLVGLKSVAVFPAEFNLLCEQLGGKGAALTRLTLQLLGEILPLAVDEPVLVVCDKHGGRNRYAAALQDHFPEYLVEVHSEGRAQSVYRWGPPGRRVEIRFESKGERFLPTAMASMASKYLRELAMRSLNAFWCGRVAELRATAGYPVDAKRFKSEIADVQQQMNIVDKDLWRAK